MSPNMSIRPERMGENQGPPREGIPEAQGGKALAKLNDWVFMCARRISESGQPGAKLGTITLGSGEQ